MSNPGDPAIRFYLAGGAGDRRIAAVHGYDRLTARLTELLGSQVPLLVGPPGEVPGAGVVLLHASHDLAGVLASLPETALERIVPMRVPTGELAPLLARFPLGGAVELHGCRHWSAGWPMPGGWSGVVGRRDLLDGPLHPLDLGGVPYAMIEASADLLPEVLAGYLRRLVARAG